MKKSTRAFKEGCAYGWTLLCSPFIGAFDGIRAAANRPKAANWKELAVNDFHLYFAPLTGAIDGVRKALKGSHTNAR